MRSASTQAMDETCEDIGSRNIAASECHASLGDEEPKRVDDSASAIARDESVSCCIVATGLTNAGRKRGRGRPPASTPTPAGTRVTSYVNPKDGAQYEVNDCVYLEASKPNEPYRIGRVKDFVMSKRDTLLVNVSLFYRFSEVPEQVCQRLVQDRRTELPSDTVDIITDHSLVKARELFQSEKTDSFRASTLRGKCAVVPFQDVNAAKSFLPLPDTFFTTLHYNPETRRLATIQGEIRIGASHQARLPECRADTKPEERSGRECKGRAGEMQSWRPGGMCDSDVIMYLRAARSVAAFAGMCNGGGSAAEGARSACRDDTTQSAMDTLHASGYNRDVALAALVKSPLARSVDRRWSEDDSKKFMKGLRICGKNFFKIRKEYLPHRDTCDLIEYYYYWKKLPVAFGSRPNARRRAGFLRRSSARPTNSEEGSSSVSDESELDGSGEIVCFKCDTVTSQQWHQVEDRGYICEECTDRYKKYGGSGGENGGDGEYDDIPDYMFRPVLLDRTGDAMALPTKAIGRGMSCSPATPDLESPGDGGTTSSSCGSKSPKKRLSPRSDLTAPEADVCAGVSTEADEREEHQSDGNGPFVTAAVIANAASSTRSPPHINGDAGISAFSSAVRAIASQSSVSCKLPSQLSSTPPRSGGARSDDGEDTPLPLIKAEPGLPLNGNDAEVGSRSDDRSPSPVAIEQQCHASKNALFYRVLSRHNNACARCDIIFKPHLDHSLAKNREECSRMLEVKVKEEKKEERTERATEAATARSYHGPSSATNASSRSAAAAADRSSSSTPRLFSDPYYPLSGAGGHCSTPALMHLGQLARPHSFAGEDYARQLAAMMQQQHRLLGGVYPPDLRSALERGGGMPPELRERLEMAAWKQQQEGTGGRELFEMQAREMMKADLEKQQHIAAAVAMSVGLNPRDTSLMAEFHRRLAAAGGGGILPPGMHTPMQVFPGYYQQAAASEGSREMLSRLGGCSAWDSSPTWLPPPSPSPPARAPSNRGSRSSQPSQQQQQQGCWLVPGYVPPPPPSDSPLSMTERLGFPPPPAHSHTHTHTHLHLHQPTNGELSAPFLPPHLPPPPPPSSGGGSSSEPSAATMAALMGGNGLPAYMLPPPGMYPHPALFGLQASLPTSISSGRDMPALDFISRQFDPLLAQQLSHHEFLQRQMLMERERHLAAAAAASGHPH